MKSKKIFSVILAFLMVVSMLPSLVFAAEESPVKLDGKLKIKGLASVGTELCANYTKVTPEGVTDEDVSFEWSRKTGENDTNTVTQVGLEKTYTLTEEDLGSKIELKITGLEEKGFTGELKATTVEVVPEGEMPAEDLDNADDDGQAAAEEQDTIIEETADGDSTESSADEQGGAEEINIPEASEDGTVETDEQESTGDETGYSEDTEYAEDSEYSEDSQSAEDTETIENTEDGEDAEDTEDTSETESLDTDDSAIVIENEQTLVVPEEGAAAEQSSEETEASVDPADTQAPEETEGSEGTEPAEETETTEGTDPAEFWDLAFTVAPKSGEAFDFGTAAAGYTNPTSGTVSIDNVLTELKITATVEMEDSSAEPAFTAKFSNDKDTVALSPGNAESLTIQPITGLTEGVYSGKVLLKNALGYDLATYPLSFTVTAPQVAKVTADPASGTAFDFGQMTEGYAEAPAAQTISLANQEGTAAANLSIALDEAGQAAFTASISKDTLEAGATDPAVVSVQPLTGLAAGKYSGQLSILQGDSTLFTYTVAFSVAQQDVYALAADPAALDFGTLEAGYQAAPAALTVTVKNNGNTTIDLKQPESTSFEIGALSAVTLGAGQTATFTVRPKTGLGEGVYEQDIVVASAQSQTTVKAVFTVSRASIKLTGITKPSDITGLANGTKKTSEALKLPETVTISTTNGKMKASVKWDVKGSAYDSSSAEGQTFTVKGTVTLPSGVTNPNNISLITSVKVSVNGRTALLADPANNTVEGISSTGSYTTETKITITANGAGMDNTTPGTGDTRYVPVSWKVLEARNWEQAPYTATFRMSKKGDYTLTVTYNQQKYDGSSWVNTGAQDTKQVSFQVAAAAVDLTPAVTGTDASQSKAVKTGDDTPIGAFVVILVIAIVAIVGIVVYRKKKN